MKARAGPHGKRCRQAEAYIKAERGIPCRPGVPPKPPVSCLPCEHDNACRQCAPCTGSPGGRPDAETFHFANSWRVGRMKRGATDHSARSVFRCQECTGWRKVITRELGQFFMNPWNPDRPRSSRQTRRITQGYLLVRHRLHLRKQMQLRHWLPAFGALGHRAWNMAVGWARLTAGEHSGDIGGWDDSAGTTRRQSRDDGRLWGLGIDLSLYY